MKKTGFKTFVCSFVFSLFIIFVINGLFFYSPDDFQQTPKIPEKNIALFFTRASNSPLPARVKPVAKIALSLPPSKIPPSQQAAVSRTKPLFSPAKEDNTGNKEPQQEIRDIIPLEIAADSFSRSDTALASAEDMTKAPALNGISSITDSDNDSGGDYDTGNDDYGLTLPADETPMPLLSAQNEATDPPLNSIKSITDPDNNKDQGGWDTGNDDYTVDQQHGGTPKPLLIAQNDAKAEPFSSRTVTDNTADSPVTGSKDLSSEQNLLIPLQKDFGDNHSPDTFKVVQTADKNQIAMVNGNTPLGSMIKEKEDIGSGTIRREPEQAEENRSDTKKNWESMAEKEGAGNPWSAAKGTKFPKNNAVLEEDYYKNAEQAKLQAEFSAQDGNNDKPIKLASDMVQNILIPIPEDILNDENLTPQLESSGKDRKIEEEVTRREQEKNRENMAAQELKAEISKEDSVSLPDKDKSEKKSGGLLKSITSIFSGSSSSDSAPREVGAESGSNSFMDRIAGRVGLAAKGNAPSKILPAEMRLAFQPNRAEISGVTLKWLQAFANKVKTDRSVILEIRIDGTSSYALQQKRLNLLHNILTNKGVDYSKINTVFTTREPNSFIIRTVRINSNIDRDVKESRDQAAYYQAW